MTKVLVIDDEEVLARTICSYLRRRDVEAIHALDRGDALSKFASLRPDVTFLDFRVGDADGLEILGQLRRLDPDAHVVMMTGHGDIELAVQAMKQGARDFMTKPVPLATIATIVAGAGEKSAGLSTHTLRRGSDQDAPRNATQILGRSAAIEQSRKSVSRILTATRSIDGEPPPVLITGESGTGKELIARALHQGGPRVAGPFVAVNCAALPAELVESELFGHEKGAFTDAKAAKSGLFEAASGGILFLDEVGDMPLDAQAKLLRVLESRTFRRVGGVKEQPVDVWVITATNRNLADRVADGTFRNDLMFRLQVLWVDLPPLRERDSDVILLAEHFLTAAAAKYKMAAPALSMDARAMLVGHTWPGNIRELRNVMERALLTASSAEIDASDIAIADSRSTTPQMISEGATLQEIEVTTLKSALSRSDGNISRAAGMLGISRDTLRYRMQKFGLGRGQDV